MERGSEPAEAWSRRTRPAFVPIRTSISATASPKPRDTAGTQPGLQSRASPALHDWPCPPFQLHLHSLPPVPHSVSLEFLLVREHAELSPAT